MSRTTQENNNKEEEQIRQTVSFKHTPTYHSTHARILSARFFPVAVPVCFSPVVVGVAVSVAVAALITTAAVTAATTRVFSIWHATFDTFLFFFGVSFFFLVIASSS